MSATSLNWHQVSLREVGHRFAMDGSPKKAKHGKRRFCERGDLNSKKCGAEAWA